MGNNLNANIEDRFVLLKNSWFKQEMQPIIEESPQEKVFLAQGGFGCNPELAGNAVFGTFVIDNERTRVEGYHIERFATLEEIEAAMVERETRLSESDTALLAAYTMHQARMDS